MFRLVQSVGLALLLALALGVSGPATAYDDPLPPDPVPTDPVPTDPVPVPPPADPIPAEPKSQRVFEFERQKKNWRTFIVKGKVEELVKGKVLVQRKDCRACKWKTVRKVKTNKNTRFRTKIFAPNKGKWFWRFQVNAKDGYPRSRSIKIAAYLPR